MDISFHSYTDIDPLNQNAKGALVILANEETNCGHFAKAEEAGNGKLKKAIAESRFEYKKKQIFSLIAPEGLAYQAVIVAGLGKGDKLEANCYEHIGGAILSELNRIGVKHADIVNHTAGDVDATASAVHLAIGLELKSYRFDKYFTKLKDSDKPTTETIAIACKNPDETTNHYSEQQHVLKGTLLARDLLNEPANVLNPVSYAKLIEETFVNTTVKTETLGEKEMSEQGFGALLGVGQGSRFESKMVIMHYNGAGDDSQPIAFLGKGVTFDSGGISIKPSAGMEAMKMDMGGSAAVVGLMKALAGRNAKVNVVGVVGLVENMCDGNAQRPGDVVTSLSGQTIEVLNTDAEGRLVLADCLWYTQDRFKPKFMINLATLTGAIMVALGETTGGLFSNNDELVEKLKAASKTTGEALWHMPMGEEYDALLKSDIADMQNISSGRWGGSITAAQFLQRFVNDVPWAHLDIAGVATASKTTDICLKGGTGFGVRILNEMVKTHYEK